MSKLIKINILISCMMALNGCNALNGVVVKENANSSGTYYSKDRVLSVGVPVSSSKNNDGDAVTIPVNYDYDLPSTNAVNFSADGFWMRRGEYHVDQLKEKIEKNAEKALPIAMKKIILSEKQSNLDIKSCKYIRIRNTKAYQCIGYATMQNIPAIYVGTSIFINGKLVNVYGLEPLWHGNQFHWDRYNHLINSIQIQ